MPQCKSQNTKQPELRFRAILTDDGPDVRLERASGRTERVAATSTGPRAKWVAVPVPDSRISPEIVDLAREATKDNSTPSAAGRRVWELTGGILRCGECHTNMMSHSFAGARVKGRLFYCCCRKSHHDSAEGYSHKRNRRADEVEPLV